MDSSVPFNLKCTICHGLLTEEPAIANFMEQLLQPKKRRKQAHSQVTPKTLQAIQPTISSTANSSLSPAREHVIPEICTASCGHIFHQFCIIEWTKKNPACPICRKCVVPSFLMEWETFKLIKVFLPLVPRQCKNCEDLSKELESVQVKYALEKSVVDGCKEREEEQEGRCSQLIQNTVELHEKLKLEEERVKKYEMQLDVEQQKVKDLQDELDKQEIENVIENHKIIMDCEMDICRLREELRMKEEKILELELSDKLLREKCARLQKDENQNVD